MTKTTLTATACAALLWAGAAFAKFTPSPQQNCDSARITAWKTYVSCVDKVLAKDAKGVEVDRGAACAKCRHAYFTKWKGFQSKTSLTGSTCMVGLDNRFTEDLVS